MFTNKVKYDINNKTSINQIFIQIKIISKQKSKKKEEKMLSIIKSMSLTGLDGYLVYVQVDISAGMPGFEIVGLPDTSIKEAKERVKTAIKNSGIEFPSRKIIVNLAPADIRKEGTFFDLPIAIGILMALKEISKIKIKNFESTIFLGELSLDGKINRVNGILPMCIEALELGIKRVVLPKENAIEASIIKGLEIIPVEDLLEAIEYITGDLEIPSYVSKENINLSPTQNYEFDFSDVKGQENAKRALEIAATGSHNCLLCRCTRFGKKPIIRKNSYNFTRFDI